MNRLAVFSMTLLPALIQFAENIHGPKNGPSKLSTVVQLAQAALANMAAFGFIPLGVAHDILGITQLTEGKVQAMKESGQLVSATDQETTPIVDGN